MFSATTSRVLLLQVAAFFSGAAARCAPACSPEDPLIALLGSDNDAAVPFCSDFLGLAVSTVSATVTPTVVATVTETSLITGISTDYDETITVTVPAVSISTVMPFRRHVKPRSVAYPEWLPTTHPARRVSSACACLSISQAVTTDTATAEAVTITDSATVTETTTSTTTKEIAVVTVTATPAPVKLRVKIQVLHKDNGASQGWLYYSNGPAVTSPDQQSQGSTFNFTLPPGAATASQMRIDYEGGVDPPSLSFFKDNHPSDIVDLADRYGSLSTGVGTPPGSLPVVTGPNRHETDIWIINTETRMISWQWIATDGTLPTVTLWKIGGRLYPVGSLTYFNGIMSMSGDPPRTEVVLRYALVSE